MRYMLNILCEVTKGGDVCIVIICEVLCVMWDKLMWGDIWSAYVKWRTEVLPCEVIFMWSHIQVKILYLCEVVLMWSYIQVVIVMWSGCEVTNVNCCMVNLYELYMMYFYKSCNVALCRLMLTDISLELSGVSPQKNLKRNAGFKLHYLYNIQISCNLFRNTLDWSCLSISLLKSSKRKHSHSNFISQR